MIIDTFPEFQKSWKKRGGWLEYIQKYPELFEKIKWDYDRYSSDWRDYLKVLSQIDITSLQITHRNLRKDIQKVQKVIKQCFGVESSMYNIVIYVGLENGAGWVTEFLEKPSILFGLEAISRLNWSSRTFGLVAHEFGHLVHRMLRDENIEKLENEEIYLLYTEGIAQRIEDFISGRPWHLEEKRWFEWCQRNNELLKKEFLRRVEEGEGLNMLFGSWYSFMGWKFTGYYLSYEFILWLEKEYNYSIKEIMKIGLSEIKEKIMEFLVVE